MHSLGRKRDGARDRKGILIADTTVASQLALWKPSVPCVFNRLRLFDTLTALTWVQTPVGDADKTKDLHGFPCFTRGAFCGAVKPSF
jgi:hypothetical protein